MGKREKKLKIKTSKFSGQVTPYMNKVGDGNLRISTPQPKSFILCDIYIYIQNIKILGICYFFWT